MIVCCIPELAAENTEVSVTQCYIKPINNSVIRRDATKLSHWVGTPIGNEGLLFSKLL